MNESYKIMEFGKLLEYLLQISGQKNYALAAQLGYDVSYISKWITKSNLPANKNMAVIIEGITTFLMETLSPLTLDQLCNFYQLENKEQLCMKLETSLLECYHFSSHKQTMETKSAQDYRLLNSHFSVNPRLQRMTLHDHMPTAEKGQDMIIFTNLFLMGKEDKLSISGFDRDKSLTEQRMRIMISLQRDPANLVFDSLLLIYMMTNYANCDFSLYLSDSVPCSLMLAVKDCYCHTSILVSNHRCISSNTCTQKPLVNELYTTMEDVIHNQAKHVFRRIRMQEMITSNSYMQSIIAPRMRWLVGTISEQFLPSDLFHELLDIHVQDKTYKEQLERNYMIMQNATMVSPIQILLYESTLSKYMLDGEMDFFTIPITMDIRQRQRHISYMRELFYKNPYIEVRFIDGFFIEDFKKFDNPSLYVSETLSYLRIHSDHSYRLHLVLQKEASELFFQFFEEIWEHRQDIVLRDAEAIQKKLQYYISCFQLFKTLE